MRMIIVDDESEIAEALQEAYAWETIGITEVEVFSDSILAMERIRSVRVDIMLTDIKMPKLDGLQLSEKALAINPDMKIIMISGYDDFSYAHQALKLGVLDYQLKPFSFEEIIESVQKACTMLAGENIKRDIQNRYSEQLRQYKDVSRKLFLVNLEQECAQPREEIIKKLSELEIHNASGNCCIVCLGIGEELREGVWDMDTDRELLQFAMENILNEILGDNGIALHENASMTVVFLFRCVSEKQAGEQIRNCISVLEETLFVRIDSGIGKIYDSVSGLYQSLTEAKQNYEQNVFYHTHYLREVGADDSYPYPEAIEQELLATITFSGDLHQDAITLVNQWFEQCRREKSISRSRAISVWSLMLAMLTKKMSQLNVEHFNRQNADGWKRLLEQSKTILDLQGQVLGSLEQFFDAIREESRSRADRIVRQIINYIDENLEQDLSLGMLANQVSLSPGYLAVLLKKHLGTNHSKYITQRRLERAKQLLKHTDKRIGEIAEMVGYSDVRYFNKVFKQNIGCKPSDYRKKNHI